MIVDDDEDIRDALAMLFQLNGFEIELASDGAEAIELLEAGFIPSVIFVDLLMPGIVGQELLEYLKSDERFVGVPIAIVSASPQLAPPGYAVFPKPVKAKTLIDFASATA
jgi:CheY-like chemotaxis protein